MSEHGIFRSTSILFTAPIPLSGSPGENLDDDVMKYIPPNSRQGSRNHYGRVTSQSVRLKNIRVSTDISSHDLETTPGISSPRCQEIETILKEEVWEDIQDEFESHFDTSQRNQTATAPKELAELRKYLPKFGRRFTGIQHPWNPMQLILWGFSLWVVLLTVILILLFFNQEHYFILFPIHGISIIFLFSLIRVSSIDPSSPACKRKFSNSNSNEANNETTTEKMDYCKHCETLVESNSKHCFACNRCVLNFDHHCVWLNTCIGVGSNYKIFALFLASSIFVFLEYLGYLAIIIEQEFFQGTNLGFIKGNGNILPELEYIVLGISAITGIGSILALFFVLPLATFHIYLWIKGETTWRVILKKRMKLKQKEEEEFNSLDGQGRGEISTLNHNIENSVARNSTTSKTFKTLKTKPSRTEDAGFDDELSGLMPGKIPQPPLPLLKNNRKTLKKISILKPEINDSESDIHRNPAPSSEKIRLHPQLEFSHRPRTFSTTNKTKICNERGQKREIHLHPSLRNQRPSTQSAMLRLKTLKKFERPKTSSS